MFINHSNTKCLIELKNLLINKLNKPYSLHYSSEATNFAYDKSKNLSSMEHNYKLSDLELYANVDQYSSYLRPTFNFASYVNKSETLQNLVKLGVDLSKIEKKKGIMPFLLKLDFERDLKHHITFLHDIGIPGNALSKFLTKNPLIFKEELSDLQTRINYLEFKGFNPSGIVKIIIANPYWLMFTTTRIDKRLGYFQKTFKLTGTEVRSLAVKNARLLTYNLEHIRKSTFSIEKEMGFTENEMKSLLLQKPKLWMIDYSHLIERYDYIHHTMKLTHDQIVKTPEILLSREFRIKQRHEFLLYVNKAQYDNKRDMFISPKSLVEGSDREFVLNIANSNIKTYETFLKTL